MASGGGINTALSSVDSSAYRGDKFGIVDLTPARPVDDGAKASEVWAATAKTAMVATRDLLGMVLGGMLFNSVKIENYDKGKELQPISLASGILFLGAPRVRHT